MSDCTANASTIVYPQHHLNQSHKNTCTYVLTKPRKEKHSSLCLHLCHSSIYFKDKKTALKLGKLF